MDRFFTAESIANPYTNYADLHDKDPVHRLEDEDDVFLVTRHDDCEYVLSDAETFSSKAGPGLRQRSLMSAPTVVADAKYRVVRTLLTNDPPSHSRYRRLVAKAFSARRMAGMEDFMRETLSGLIDDLDPSGDIDFVTDLAEPLPLIVIASFLGVPLSDLDDFRRWSIDAAEVLGGQLTPERSQECHDSLIELLGYFDRQLAERQENPREDFLTALLEGPVNGEDPLTREEMLSIAYVTLVAGNETTANLLSSAMLLLLHNPQVLEQVQEERDLIPLMVEEALRLEAPVQGSVRVATRDASIGDVNVPQGSRVLVVAGAANYDPEVFPEPDQMDLERDNGRSHLTFGKGIHLCLGASLSRIEARIMFDVLFDHFDQFELAHSFDPPYAQNAVLRSLKSLPMHVSQASA